MAGIYIHIPFCRQACHYCDFHFSTNLSRKNEMIMAIAKEIENSSEKINDQIHTIYFGGGTPSLLSQEELRLLFATIHQNYEVCNEAEVTLEANPEDLSTENATGFLEAGINRLSIGIQTFENERLKWMNRAHDSTQSSTAVANAREAGFKNISLDLIYAVPEHGQQGWILDLEKTIALNPEHISLYGLTIEPETVFGKWERDQKLVEVPESDAADQYLQAIDLLKKSGFLHYEVSNFGKKGYHSRHNHSYWSGVPYLGFGPGAHSFDGKDQRRFNIRNNAKYIKGINENEAQYETESLSPTQRRNEQILTGLRTAKGIRISDFDYGRKDSFINDHHSFINEMQQKNLVTLDNGHLSLRSHGFLVADEIALRLFFPEETNIV
ncbi:MAG: radical SAM family heme chaperone HemW [Ekhidna sp.]|nr:radical SAM family heme chaperone HemW [Ekhidna sp.]